MNLAYNDIGIEGAGDIALLLANNYTLKLLNLSTPITKDVDQNRMQAEGLVEIGNALGRNKNLVKLQVGNDCW